MGEGRNSHNMYIWQRIVSRIYINSYSPECLKSKRVRPNDDNIKWTSSIVRDIKWFNYLKKILTVFYKTKNMLTLWPSNSTPRYFPKENESIWWQKPCKWVFLTALFIIPKQLEIACMFKNRRIEKLTEII